MSGRTAVVYRLLLPGFVQDSVQQFYMVPIWLFLNAFLLDFHILHMIHNQLIAVKAYVNITFGREDIAAEVCEPVF